MSGNRENPCGGRYAGCTADPPEGRGKCESCAAEHARRGAARRAALKNNGRCTVCGKPAVRVDGVTLTTCKAHREYYRARSAGS